MNAENVTYFDSFGVENIPNSLEIKKIIANSYRIQVYDFIICEYAFIGFINFILKGNTNLFFPTKYKKNDKIKLRYFQ